MAAMEVNDIIKALSGALNCVHSKDQSMLCINTAMAESILDALQESQRKDGHWIILENCSNAGVYCSVCNTKVFEFTHRPKRKISRYCPHCGAWMEQEKIYTLWRGKVDNER